MAGIPRLPVLAARAARVRALPDVRLVQGLPPLRGVRLQVQLRGLVTN